MEPLQNPHDDALWDTYDYIASRLRTKRLCFPTAEQEAGVVAEHLHPIALDGQQEEHLQEQLQAVATQAGLCLPDLLRWAVVHLQPSRDPVALTMDVVRLEQLVHAVQWQQRRFDCHAQSQLADGAQVNVFDIVELRQLLAASAGGPHR